MGGDKEKLIVLLLSGGAGKRFWPISTEKKPKHLLPLFENNKTLMHLTYERALLLTSPDNIYIVTIQNLVDDIKEICKDVPGKNYIIEPLRKNTAPAITYSVMRIMLEKGDRVMLVMPSDHYIEGIDAFVRKMKISYRFVSTNNALMTFGIKPTYPHTGYGYIQVERINNTPKPNTIYHAKLFVEKPSEETARMMIQSGEYYWNSGMFMWRMSFFLSELEKHAPYIYLPLKEYFDNNISLEACYSSLSNISIDNALMEKSDNVYITPLKCKWKDLGTWKSLYKHFIETDRERGMCDNDRNIIMNGNIHLINAERNIIYSEFNAPVILNGVSGMVIALTKNGFLIWPMDKENEIKSVQAKIGI